MKIDPTTGKPIDEDDECDITEDMARNILDESLGLHSALLGDSRASIVQAQQFVSWVAGKKFNELDPLEAAAAEKILKP